MNQEIPQPDSQQPAPKELHVDLDKITPQRMKETWDTLNLPEKKLIITIGDKEFAEIIESLELEVAKKWALFRILIKAKSPLIYAMVQGQKTELVGAENRKKDKVEKNAGKIETSAEKDKLLDLGFKESEDKTFLYTALSGPYLYENGLSSARRKFSGVEIKYPSEQQAINLLQEFRKEFPDKAVAIFIDQKNTFVYLSKTGKQGRFQSERVPQDTELFVVVVAGK